jgi:RNA polymerase sigma factor (sigma-70 family)
MSAEPNASHLRRQGVWNTVTIVTLDGEDLARRFAAGDPEAVRTLYRSHGRLVFAIAFRVLGDAGQAEDATQQTFVQAWRAAATYDPDRPIEAWLTTIARRAAIDVLRRERRHRGVEGVNAQNTGHLVTLPPSAEQIHEVTEVRNALAELSEPERELLRLQHYDQLTQAEVAVALDIPVGTVKSRTFRAHRRLAERLSHLRDDAEPRHTRTEGGAHG